ncbi:MAG: hypothetical protein ACD_30C00040G0013 [uncultured bacterium]|uniref:Aminopeptidase n=4 Tax=Candidatus Daviesiibacteriota TaxID=1752718 RepID=A0A0G0ETM3_9BACT|nr:MAG: hypothetical protein ACD_30C00040G0013 [uncultured bacterium]KKQ10183.1 MAG: hypothetical protein US19_C0008G0026 [Candidatus Daviesbacteria bacterium GW2011_GWB1_36_5]KKQ15069.1 MAG: hypothetical protein US28_C0024G0026 [Candidatus Daviesbacteria bacterium GW2011_GWA1_36_8]OGE17140.1 MAG: hypothetical protein A2858_00350 [Candidatus Daviesbacteria bacterium RIFCSPHIGHO2_01_FULL_36_37]OGE35921.1 MAG: hypothetical protein A3E66_01345 [Candidatus Daviesbacteria bacterium RIFCSPHIGHO2_12_F
MIKKSARLPAHIKPERYEIFLKPDLEGFTFTGEETMWLSLDKPSKAITLHAAELEVFSEDANVSYDQAAETVTLTFKKPISGKQKIKLKFTGILNDQMRGFYRSKYIHNGEEKYLATTQFESTDARRAFPCIDEPSAKAVFDVTLMVPKEKTVISNTIESEVLEHDGGYKSVKFESTPRMSTYLLAFIVGDFEYIEKKTKGGVMVRVFVTPGKSLQAKFALDVAVKTLDFYEDYFDIKYPLPVSDLIAIPDFAAGAMENWGAVTYRESAILVDPEKSSTANKQWVALVIAHELAHQWFGNLVTMEWWTHLWLNEGFASFIEYLAVDKIFPEWDIWTQFVYSDLGSALKLDALENTHPIEVEVVHPSEIAEIFDRVSYSKGASVLRMLYNYLGDKDFRDGLRHYLKKHAYSNALTEDLWHSLEEVSGKPVTKIMGNWTSKPGYPLIQVFDSGKNLRLTQSRFYSSPLSRKSSEDKTVWTTPIYFKKSGSKKIGHILINKKTTEIGKPSGWIKLNSGEVSITRIDYPSQLLLKLKDPISKKELEAPDRLGVIRDAFDLSQSDQLPTHFALELAQGYKNEDDFTVWAEITSQLNTLDNLITHEKFYDNFRLYGQDLYDSIAKKVGWSKKSGEPHTTSLLRSLVLSALGGFGHRETIKKAFDLFEDLKMGESMDPDLRGVVLRLVAENGSKKEHGILKKLYVKEPLQEERNRLARALSMFKQPELLKDTLEFALSQHVRFQDSIHVIAGVWSNPYGSELAWIFFKKNFKKLRKIYAGGHFMSRLLGAAGSMVKVSQANDLEKFFKKNPVPEATRTIAQASEQIRSNAAWLKRDRKGIEKFLSNTFLC